MSIETIPLFYYIDPIDSTNNLMDFIEPNQLAVNLVGTISFGSRSITNLLIEVQRALNDAGVNTYSVTFDRDTRLVTISADDDFNLLVSSGDNASSSPWTLLGFVGDQTGSDNYTGTVAIGNTYSPQFTPQDFAAFEDNLEAISPAVRESADGIVEVVSFGNRSFMTLNFKYITNRKMGKNSPIENNPNALQEARDFMTFAIGKTDMEFMIDRDDKNTFVTVLLEKTPGSRNGTKFVLKELISRKLKDYYETGKITFRKV